IVYITKFGQVIHEFALEINRWCYSVLSVVVCLRFFYDVNWNMMEFQSISKIFVFSIMVKNRGERSYAFDNIDRYPPKCSIHKVYLMDILIKRNVFTVFSESFIQMLLCPIIMHRGEHCTLCILLMK